MTVFRKSIAMLLVAWITIVGHVAVALPFCQRGEDDSQTVTHQQSGVQQDADGHEQGCAQHQQQTPDKGSLDCDSCGMCHMACHAVPPVAAGVKTALPDRVYLSAPAPRFISFVPERPQPVPLTLFV